MGGLTADRSKGGGGEGEKRGRAWQWVGVGWAGTKGDGSDTSIIMISSG